MNQNTYMGTAFVHTYILKKKKQRLGIPTFSRIHSIEQKSNTWAYRHSLDFTRLNKKTTIGLLNFSRFVSFSLDFSWFFSISLDFSPSLSICREHKDWASQFLSIFINFSRFLLMGNPAFSRFASILLDFVGFPQGSKRCSFQTSKHESRSIWISLKLTQKKNQ